MSVIRDHNGFDHRSEYVHDTYRSFYDGVKTLVNFKDEIIGKMWDHRPDIILTDQWLGEYVRQFLVASIQEGIDIKELVDF
jgi:hypothetical protein